MEGSIQKLCFLILFKQVQYTSLENKKILTSSIHSNLPFQTTPIVQHNDGTYTVITSTIYLIRMCTYRNYSLRGNKGYKNKLEWPQTAEDTYVEWIRGSWFKAALVD